MQIMFLKMHATLFDVLKQFNNSYLCIPTQSFIKLNNYRVTLYWWRVFISSQPIHDVRASEYFPVILIDRDRKGFLKGTWTLMRAWREIIRTSSWRPWALRAQWNISKLAVSRLSPKYLDGIIGPGLALQAIFSHDKRGRPYSAS